MHFPAHEHVEELVQTVAVGLDSDAIPDVASIISIYKLEIPPGAAATPHVLMSLEIARNFPPDRRSACEKSASWHCGLTSTHRRSAPGTEYTGLWFERRIESPGSTSSV